MIVPDKQIDLWCAFLEECDTPELDERYRGVLTPDETQRAARFHFEKDRWQFVVTRALVRDVLSRYVGLEPSALAFIQNEYGKPALAQPTDCPVSFSLSHTPGLSVCAVASTGMIGVDVERLDRTNCHPDIANRFFAPSEAAYLEGLSGEERRLEFLRLWTLKEAFVKARGKGLSIPLDSFAIGCSPGQPPRILLQDGSEGKESGWRFLQIRLRDSFQVAIAIPMPERREVGVRVSKLLPMTEQSTSVRLKPNPLNDWTLGEV